MPSRPATTTELNVPGSASSSWAVAVAKSTAGDPAKSAVDPNPAVPATVKGRTPPLTWTRTESPTR
jgi:hypothetical protein